MENVEANKIVDSFTLVAGVGNFDAHQACIMSACVAKWRLLHGEKLGTATDTLECVCEVLREYVIRLNDADLWKSDQERTNTLLPFVDRLLNTKGSSALMQKRAFLCADRAVRVFAPIAFDSAGLHEQAITLRSLAPIVDVATARTARAAANAAAYAAGYTGYAASTAAKAASTAANAAAYTAGYAASTAAKAAGYAASTAANAAAYTAGYAASTAKAAGHAASTAANAAAYTAKRAAANSADAVKTEAIKLLSDLCDMKEPTT